MRVATGAADMMFRCVFEGSLSMCDMDIERRPYHRNCTCALHKQKSSCSNALPRSLLDLLVMSIQQLRVGSAAMMIQNTFNKAPSSGPRPIYKNSNEISE
ncbi:Hypothetical predicted protein [Olea europaea subsp. europaea]|uniref:Uncharacterized protein n=1 Tax=Olea europaea subsp. europaea TaxID=158383 RepID=A0A8S0UDI2_OLEEU|nr:Hypothetical predicted protein [Olea europaea subsp. europaea]